MIRKLPPFFFLLKEPIYRVSFPPPLPFPAQEENKKKKEEGKGEMNGQKVGKGHEKRWMGRAETDVMLGRCCEWIDGSEEIAKEEGGGGREER